MTSLLLAALLAACGDAPQAPVVDAPKATTQANAQDGRQVEVLISGAGYTPDRIDAKPGEALNITFDRPDGANCGGSVVFPATGAKHEIPVGEKVTVSVTAPPSGELTFTCGMDMYRGSVVVTGG